MRSPLSATRLVLVPRAERNLDVPVRRYRLARLRFDTDPSNRYAHLKRIYD